MSWWPWNKAKKAEQRESTAEFHRLLQESKAKTDDLEVVAERLKKNRREIHKRAAQLIGEENVVAARKVLKSYPG